MNKYNIGRRGEEYISKVLGQSGWMNEGSYDNKNYFDFVYKDILIDVKTTVVDETSSELKKLFASRGRFTFTPGWYTREKHPEIIYIFVAFYNEKVYLWVNPAKKTKQGFTGKIINAITSDKLKVELEKYKKKGGVEHEK